MFQKAKYLLIGLVAGLILATAALAYAADQSIKLIINGQEISFPDAPPQIINDRVMVPARPLAEALGATVGWDEEQQAVIVTSNAPGQNLLEEPVQDQVPEEPAKEGSNIQTYERDGELFVIENEVEYYPAAWISGVIYEKGYSLKFNPETKEVYMTHNDDPGMSLLKARTVLENIPYKIFNERTCIQKDYYENTILPLIK